MHQLTLSITQACSTLSLSRSSIYKLINGKRLRAIKIGSRTLVTVESLQALVGGLNEVTSDQAGRSLEDAYWRRQPGYKEGQVNG